MREDMSEPTIIYEDNQPCIEIANNQVNNGRTKHIDLQYHFVREAIEEGVIRLEYKPTNEMVADILTKMPPRAVFEKLQDLMGVTDVGKC